MTFTTSCILGGLISAVAWLVFWPVDDQEPPMASGQLTGLRVQARKVEIDFDLLGNDSLTYREREDVNQELKRISTGAIESRLEEMLQGEQDDSFTSASGILLAEWGRRAPEAALQWAWDHLKNSNYWNWAWQQIGPEWACSDPDGFLQYFREHSRESQSVTPADAEKSETPLILGDAVHYYQKWLAKGSLKVAFTYLREKESYYENDHEFTDTLHTEQEFAEALSAWDGYHPDPGKNPEFLPTGEMIALKITNRWREEFPESFAKSRYEGWPILDRKDPKLNSIQKSDHLESSSEDVGKQRDLQVLQELLNR